MRMTFFLLLLTPFLATLTAFAQRNITPGLDYVSSVRCPLLPAFHICSSIRLFCFMLFYFIPKFYLLHISYVLLLLHKTNSFFSPLAMTCSPKLDMLILCYVFRLYVRTLSMLSPNVVLLEASGSRSRCLVARMINGLFNASQQINVVTRNI